MRIGVFGNCQARGLGAALDAWAPGHDIVVQAAARLDLDDPEAVDAALGRLLACDRLLIQSLETRRPQFAAFVTALLAGAGGCVERWPLVVFNGFHPDCVYVLRDGTPLPGAAARYHSALAAAAWIEGLPAARAAGIFNAYAYASLGYFDAYQTGLAGLVGDALHGYDLSRCIGPGRRFMHTINHPTIDISVEIGRQALDRLGLDRRAEINRPADPLANDVVWPLYPEIADRLGVAPAADGPDFDRLVVDNYRALDEALPNSRQDASIADGPFGGAAVERARAFIRDEVL